MPVYLGLSKILSDISLRPPPPGVEGVDYVRFTEAQAATYTETAFTESNVKSGFGAVGNRQAFENSEARHGVGQLGWDPSVGEFFYSLTEDAPTDSNTETQSLGLGLNIKNDRPDMQTMSGVYGDLSKYLTGQLDKGRLCRKLVVEAYYVSNGNTRAIFTWDGTYNNYHFGDLEGVDLLTGNTYSGYVMPLSGSYVVNCEDNLGNRLPESIKFRISEGYRWSLVGGVDITQDVIDATNAGKDVYFQHSSTSYYKCNEVPAHVQGRIYGQGAPIKNSVGDNFTILVQEDVFQHHLYPSSSPNNTNWSGSPHDSMTVQDIWFIGSCGHSNIEMLRVGEPLTYGASTSGQIPDWHGFDAHAVDDAVVRRCVFNGHWGDGEYWGGQSQKQILRVGGGATFTPDGSNQTIECGAGYSRTETVVREGQTKPFNPLPNVEVALENVTLTSALLETETNLAVTATDFGIESGSTIEVYTAGGSLIGTVTTTSEVAKNTLNIPILASEISADVGATAVTDGNFVEVGETVIPTLPAPENIGSGESVWALGQKTTFSGAISRDDTTVTLGNALVQRIPGGTPLNYVSGMLFWFIDGAGTEYAASTSTTPLKGRCPIFEFPFWDGETDSNDPGGELIIGYLDPIEGIAYLGKDENNDPLANGNSAVAVSGGVVDGSYEEFRMVAPRNGISDSTECWESYRNDYGHSSTEGTFTGSGIHYARGGGVGGVQRMPGKIARSWQQMTSRSAFEKHETFNYGDLYVYTEDAGVKVGPEAGPIYPFGNAVYQKIYVEAFRKAFDAQLGLMNLTINELEVGRNEGDQAIKLNNIGTLTIGRLKTSGIAPNNSDTLLRLGEELINPYIGPWTHVPYPGGGGAYKATVDCNNCTFENPPAGITIEFAAGVTGCVVRDPDPSTVITGPHSVVNTGGGGPAPEVDLTLVVMGSQAKGKGDVQQQVDGGPDGSKYRWASVTIDGWQGWETNFLTVGNGSKVSNEGTFATSFAKRHYDLTGNLQCIVPMAVGGAAITEKGGGAGDSDFSPDGRFTVEAGEALSLAYDALIVEGFLPGNINIRILSNGGNEITPFIDGREAEIRANYAGFRQAIIDNATSIAALPTLYLLLTGNVQNYSSYSAPLQAAAQAFWDLERDIAVTNAGINLGSEAYLDVWNEWDAGTLINPATGLADTIYHTDNTHYRTWALKIIGTRVANDVFAIDNP